MLIDTVMHNDSIIVYRALMYPSGLRIATRTDTAYSPRGSFICPMHLGPYCVIQVKRCLRCFDRYV